ncbi:hypothetical protein [Paenibacillus sp. FSL H8-0537]|uniref:hypothetical protein n=1 Tax=Paenibacillus sp. FSL H8-0537 TaxID=2921399 RepID=UPI003100B715
MNTVCSELHHFAWQLPRYSFTFDKKLIPQNGIYLLFEKGEPAHGGDRIVRIGAHTGVNQLRSRLMQHFTNEKKDRSIFRKNIGRCLLHQANDPYLAVWELDATSSKNKSSYSHLIMPDYQKEIEQQVSSYMRENFTFTVLEVPSKEDRLYFESRIVSTVSLCKECSCSQSWLGLSSPKAKIRESGLWQVNELYKSGLSAEDFKRLVENT